MNRNCRKCGAKTHQTLCTTCLGQLQNMLYGLSARKTESHTMPGWLQLLADSANGQTLLGKPQRHPTNHTTPLPCDLTASQLLKEADDTLRLWATRTICAIHDTPRDSARQ